MRAVVLATAGHIDHGKTSLVHALTGVWCDRLEEEKRRGITLVLGFAPLPDPQGNVEVSFVDVPGHERLIHTMVAGAGAVDGALLVVAADEGIMPQTREHLAVLELLGISGGVVALTKADTVEADLLAQRQEELAAFLAKSPLAGAPIVPCSAVTGEGVEAVRNAILAFARGVRRREEPGRPFRLCVDRVFSLPGAGTVVTGTVRWGEVAEGETLWVYPPGREVRVRSLQVHGQNRPRGAAGERLALGLAGVKVEELPKGAQLLTPGPWEPTARVAADVRILPEAPGLSEGEVVWLHLLATRVAAKVERTYPNPAPPGSQAKAVLRLQKPLFSAPGDRVVLRRPSPPLTVGGGVVLDVAPPRLPRGKAAELAALALRPLPETLASLVEAAGPSGVTVARLAARVGFLPQALEAPLGRLLASGEAVAVPTTPPLIVATQAMERLLAQAEALVEAAKDKGLSLPELFSALRLPSQKALRQHLAEALWRRGKVRQEAGRLFAGKGSPLESPLALRLLELYRSARFEAPSPEEAAKRLSAHPATVAGLVRLGLARGDLVRLGGKWILHREVLEEVVARIRAWGVESFDVGQFKDRFGLTRKLAIPILEWLDSQRVTRRVGDRRQVIPTCGGTSSRR